MLMVHQQPQKVTVMLNSKYSSELVVLFGNSFNKHLAPIFSLFVDTLSNSDRPSLFYPLKPRNRKTTKNHLIKTENITNKNYDVIVSS